MPKLAGVVCLWEYRAGKTPVWEFVEAYGTDDDGYAVTPARHATKGCDSYDRFVNKRDRSGEPTPVMGRAVTGWSLARGVCLHEFNPPAWADWLGLGFWHRLKTDPDWPALIRDGHVLFIGTTAHVARLLAAQE